MTTTPRWREKVIVYYYYIISIQQTLKGMDHKKSFIIHLTVKRFKHKIITITCQQMFVSKLFR